MGRSNEDIMFKKQNTKWKKFVNVFKEIWDIISTIVTGFINIIIEWWAAILFVGLITFIIFSVGSCIHDEAVKSSEYLSKIDSCRSIVNQVYPSRKTFTYDLKHYCLEQSSEDKAIVTTVDNDGIINTFKVNRHNLILHENPSLEKSYVKLLAVKYTGEVLKWDATEDAIKSQIHQPYKHESTYGCNFEKISWGLFDKLPKNVLPGVWDDNDIWYDVTYLVKNINIPKLANDTEETYKNRKYYTMYVIKRIDIYIKHLYVKYE